MCVTLKEGKRNAEIIELLGLEWTIVKVIKKGSLRPLDVLNVRMIMML